MSLLKTLLSLSIVAALSVSSPMLFAQGKTIAKSKAKALSVSNTAFDKPRVEGSVEENFEDEDFDESLEDFYGDEDFVSIATGTKKLISKAPSVASVVTSADIERMGARTLSEILATIPGLHVSLSSQANAPKFKIRGISTQYNPQSLMLVDGAPISSIVRGDRHVAWGLFPIKSIARIEVIRGPGSALYGADAFAGVINIITKTVDDIKQTEWGVRAGSFNTKEAWLVSKFIQDDFNLALTAELSQSDGHDSVIDWDAQSNLDALNFAPPASFAPGSSELSYKAYDVNLNINYQEFNFKLFYQKRNDIGSGHGFALALDPHGKLASERMLIDMDYNFKLTEDIDSIVSFSHYRSNQEVDANLWLLPPGTLFGAFPDALIGNPQWYEKTSIAKFHFSYDGWNKHHLDFGFGYRKEDLYKIKESKNFDANLNPLGELVDVTDTDDVFMPESDRDSNFLYFQGEFYLAPDWELTAGIRYDDYSDFGSTTNPRLALVWTTSQKLTTKLLYGQAFRAPAFAETTVVNNPVALGNPNLKPETINTLELAFHYKVSESVDWNFNLYKYQIKDLIDFISDDNVPTVTAQNTGKISGNGAEFEVGFKINNDINVLANYSYQKAADDTVNDDLGDFPTHQAYFRFNWQALERLSLNVQFNYVGEQKRRVLDLRADVDSYINTTLSLKYRDILPSWDVSLLVNNIFNEDIREPSAGPSAGSPTVAIPNDIPQAGRSLYLFLSTTY
jgi:iron complex outermembrane receptor protein